MISDLAEQIQTAGELDDAGYKRLVQINNDFQKVIMTPLNIAWVNKMSFFRKDNLKMVSKKDKFS